MMSISVVIVEYNCMELVDRCISSLYQYLANAEWECVVVSNSLYTDNEIHGHKKYDKIKYIYSNNNSGYAGGVNLGVKNTAGDYILILNPDSYLIDASLLKLVAYFNKDSRVAAIGPKVIDETGITQYSCRRFPKKYTHIFCRSFLRNLKIGKEECTRYFMLDYNHKFTREVDWISGGAIVIKREAFSNVDGFDERYFLYMEDVDFCMSLKEHGWKILYYPDAIVVHAGQHKSIKFSLSAIKSPHFKYHVNSIRKYFKKWSRG